MSESTSFIMGMTGIGVSIFTIVLGWMPWWIVFGVLIYAGALYGTSFFATGIAGGFASGVFASMGWLPLVAYFTPIVLGALFLAVKVAGKYVNTGVNE